MQLTFEHEALALKQERSLVYTAMSKHYFYYRMHISRFVLEQSKVPLNPFMLFDYFLLDTLERNVVREANNSLLKRADELWVFGPISNGVLAEIQIAQTTHKPIHYFKIEKSQAIIPIDKTSIEMEAEVQNYQSYLINGDRGKS